VKIDKGNPEHWLLLVRQGIYSLLAVLWRWLTPTPARPLVVLYGHQLSGNLKALYEEWQDNRADEFDCAFLSLDPAYGPQLAATGVNVLRCGVLTDMLRAGRASALVSDHGLHAMSPLLYLTGMCFVDVWHGIPFKGFTPATFRVHHRYREAWVSSPLLKTLYVDRFGFRADRVQALGYARVDKLFRGEPPEPSYRRQAAIDANTPLVLYAPTWKQEDSERDLFPFGESQEAFLARLSTMCRGHGALLVVRSHLNASISELDLDNVLYCPMSEFADAESLLQDTDILICDWSSISFDFLALARPAIFLDVEPPFANGFSLGPEYRFGHVATDMDDLCRALARALADPANYMSQMEERYREITAAVYGESVDGQSAARQWRRLSELLRR